MKRLAFAAVIMMLASSWASAQFVQQGDKLVGAGAVGQGLQGSSVALSADGNTAIVGGAIDANWKGAAWAFTRSGGVWTQQGAKLVGSGGGPIDCQGGSVAISADGSTAIVGGVFGGGVLNGAAWVFTRGSGVWTQQGDKLVGSGASVAPPYGEYEGISVALSANGDTAAVGQAFDEPLGAAWVFTRVGGVWTQQGTKLVGTGVDGSWAALGWSIALSADGNTAIVGGPEDHERGGAAWVFVRSGTAWTQQGGKLVGTGATSGAGQGSSVALSADGNTAIVGSSRGNAVWVFTRSGGVWTQQGEKLVGTSTVGPAQQGAVALSGDGDTAIVGGNDATGGIAAWVFTRTGGVWTQLGDNLVGADSVGSAHEGVSVALSSDGTTAIMGGALDNDGAGAAWVFVRQGGPSALWVPVVAHTDGKNGSQWRSDVGLLNPGTGTANVTLTFHGPDGLVTNTTYVPAGAQSVLVDVLGQLSASGQGALEVSSDRSLKVTSRTYHQASTDAACDANGTKGQSYPSLAVGEGLSLGQTAWLPHLAESATYRTNIGLVNTSAAAAVVAVELYDGTGALLATYTVSLAPGEWRQETQPFNSKSAQTALDRGFAKVTVTSGAGVVAFASVIDNITNDPTTIAMQR